MACLALACLAAAAAAGEPPEDGPEARRLRAAALIAALDDKDPAVRAKAAGDLGPLTGEGEAVAPARQALLKALGDADARVGEAAARTLLRIPRTGWSLTKAYATLPVPVRTVLVRELVDSREENYSLFTMAVADPDVAIRRSAIAGLARLVEDVDLVIPPLTVALDDADREARSAALAAVAQVPDLPAATVGRLCRLLDEPDAGLRAAAANALGGLVRPGARAPGLPPRAAAAGPRLIKALTDPDPGARAAVVRAVGAVCATRESAPHLLKALEDKEPGVRAAAVPGLGRPDAGPEAIEAVLRCLKDEDPGIAQAAVRALGAIGPRDPRIAPALLGVMAEAPDLLALDPILDALVPFGTEKDVVPALVRRLKDDRHKNDRHQLLWCLSRMGPKAREAVGPLLELTENQPKDVRMMAVNALGAIGPEKGVVPVLVKALGDKDWEVRELACGALARIGGPAAEALPAIEALLKDESPEVRKVAEYAVGKIGRERPAPPGPEVF
ncbi:MAG TPA: HEAT repeat domain-containing protein [Planctomycetota bacterium]|nr:HEAT repeat domain-containing protein [Planctomycetota bacterium]